MVEAMESLFVPVLVHNNRKGKDEQILKRFNEPSWNNPVMRFLDANEKDVIPRRDRVWTTEATAARMVDALKAANRDVPPYLTSVIASASASKTETATFAMHCYWEGEAKLGSIRGVHSTRSGWKNSLEVVSVEFDPAIVDYATLVDTANGFECASKVFTHNAGQQKVAVSKVGRRAVSIAGNPSVRDAKISDQKFYLQQTPLRHLPMTEFQATKVNAAVKARKDFRKWLSPGQIRQLERVLKAVKATPEGLSDHNFVDTKLSLTTFSARLNKTLSSLEVAR